MRKILSVMAALLMVAITACKDSKTVEEPEIEPATEASRTLLVYMVANNSLGYGYDTDDLNEMKDAAQKGAFGNSRLIVYHHARNTDNPQLKEILPDGSVKIVKSYDLSVPSVHSRRMREVIADTYDYAPAHTRGIILWSHGSGWLQNGIDESAYDAETKAFGDDSGRKMNVSSLASALKDQGFDYIYFDCCYMMGVEVVYELRHCAKKIIGSVTELPAPGMPYDLVLPYLMMEEPDLETAARVTFDYYDSLSGVDRTCTMSVVKTEALDALAEATGAIYRDSRGELPTGFSPQRFMLSNCYLFDFGQYAEALNADPELIEQWRKAMAATVTFEGHTPTIWQVTPLTHHSGLSTYILDPANSTSSQDRGYNTLAWWRDVASHIYY